MKAKATYDSVASLFVLHAIQEWCQSDDDRVKAVQGVLDAAGFKATAKALPVFGGLWPKKCCVGPECDAASEWLNNLTDTMPRGEFNAEKRHVEKAITDRIYPLNT